MSHSFSENNKIDLVIYKDRRGIDSLVLMLLSSFLNQFFVCWSFVGRMTWDALPRELNLSILIPLWWFGAHVLLVIWVAFWLFKGRIKVPPVVIGLIAITAALVGGAIQSGLFSTGTLAVIRPAMFFLLNLLVPMFLVRERRFDLCIQILFSAMLGGGSGLLYLYLYLSSI
ncbi:MAG: hypothetical protein MUC83_11855 [Pirellula sp.]|jgi:hypothetical protein|nr:hypothetical protein [Pirellula sp.]